jgi:protein-tyrosine phosphatase
VIVATPHVSWRWRNSAGAIAAGVRSLTEALVAHAVPLRVHAGAEVELMLACELSDAELRTLRLGPGPWLLVEPPHTPGVVGVERMLMHLHERGHQLVLAHVERCPAFVDEPDLLARLVGHGMLASVTAASLVGGFGRTAQRAATHFLDVGLVHNVSSDAHSRHSRPPGVLEQLASSGLSEAAPWLTRDVPAAILAGTAIPPPPGASPRARRAPWRRRT